MAVSAHRWTTMRLLWFDPHVLLSVENTQARVILLAVIATEDPQLAMIQRCSMILYLRRNNWAEHGL